MRGKLLFITGGLVGYVLGARAGRKRYDQIAAAASELWHAKPVQRRVTEVRDFALEAVGDAPAALFEAGKKAYATLQGKQARTTGAAQDSTAQGSTPQGAAEDAGASAQHASAARTAAAAKVANSPVSKAPGSKAAKPASSKPASKPAAKSAAPDETTTK